MPLYDLIVIGGGAAGFYGAIHAKTLRPSLRVVIFEKSNKLLSKVRISGGGRCNVTHDCQSPGALSEHYPRGAKVLRRVFNAYGVRETVAWFATRGIDLKTEADGRMFPITDDAGTIVNGLLREAQRLNIEVRTSEGVNAIKSHQGNFAVKTSHREYTARRVLVAIGGHPRPEAYALIAGLGHTIKPPIPSLFTFNDSGKSFADLMGVAVAQTEVRIAGTKYRMQGPLLITHWGLSGPAVIRLSAWAAEHLHAVDYKFDALVSWVGVSSEEETRRFLTAQRDSRGRQTVRRHACWQLPQRLWVRLCERAGIGEEDVWGEISNKKINRLLEQSIRCPFSIRGKTTFKEEFVTCGGVDFREVDTTTMESKLVKGLFFAGEVLNMDGETGGFNFQAAWSTAWLSARALATEPERP